MRDAYIVLEDAEQRGALWAEVERLAANFSHESAVFGAAKADRDHANTSRQGDEGAW
jgi:hypothetical protein